MLSGAASVAITLPVQVDGLRRVEVQMQSDSEQRGALLQAVRCRGFQIISQRDDRIVFPGSRDPGLSKLTLGNTLRSQLAEYHDLVLVNPVFLDLEYPFGLEAFIEPLDDGTTFDVIEHVSIRALPSLDLLRRKRSFKYFSIHTRLLSMLVFIFPSSGQSERLPVSGYTAFSLVDTFVLSAVT